MKSLSVGIVGATGLVGQALIDVLKKRQFPVGKLRLFASDKSKGKRVEGIQLEGLAEGCFSGLDIVFFAAGAEVSKQWAERAVSEGALVIDNSSAFRMHSDVPLIVPEINADLLVPGTKLIANPNCSTIIALMALAPLSRAFGLKQVVAATYQAVSGSGKNGLKALETETSSWREGERSSASHYPRPIAFNVIPQVDVFLEDGSSKEEWKLLVESQKILNLPELRVSATCVRVPVIRAHSIALTAGFNQAFSLKDAEDLLRSAPGLNFYHAGDFPTPQDVSGQDLCAVGRLRLADVFPHGLSLWVSGDQILKGAALNAVQIAEEVIG